MTSVRGAIFAEIARRLRAIGGIGEVEIMPTQDPAAFPALHVFDGGHLPAESETGSTLYRLSLTIEGYHEDMGGAEAHEALTELYADVVEALLPEPPLGGLAETIDEGEYRPPAIAPLLSRSRLGFSMDFDITFRARRGAPRQPA